MENKTRRMSPGGSGSASRRTALPGESMLIPKASPPPSRPAQAAASKALRALPLPHTAAAISSSA